MAPDEEGGGGAAVTSFDELEQMQAPAPAPLDPNAVKLEGEAIPEALRGKSLADVIALQAEQQRALEASRTQIDSLRALSEARAQQPAPQAQPQQPQAEPELNAQQLRELYEKDPFEYNQYVLTNMEKKLRQQVDSRVAPLASSTASYGEAAARQKYAEEFEVLGPEITQTLAQIPDKSAFANPAAWDDFIAYVRGKHMDKIFTARQAKSNATALQQAREREAAGAGTVNNGDRRPASRQKIGELTELQKEVCKVQGISEDDFRKYYIGS